MTRRRRLIEHLIEHVPVFGADETLRGCECDPSLRLNRDADGNRLKDGAAEREWAEHVAATLANP